MARPRVHKYSSVFSWKGGLERWGHVLIEVLHASDRFVSNITCYENLMWQSHANTLTGTKANLPFHKPQIIHEEKNNIADIHCTFR